MSSHASVSLKHNTVSLSLGLMLEGIGNSLDMKCSDQFTKSTATPDNTLNARQSSARGQLRTAGGQTGSRQPLHQNLDSVFMSKHTLPCLLLTDRELVQSSLTRCRKELSAQSASLLDKSHHFVSWSSFRLGRLHVMVGKRKKPSTTTAI